MRVSGRKTALKLLPWCCIWPLVSLGSAVLSEQALQDLRENLSYEKSSFLSKIKLTKAGRQLLYSFSWQTLGKHNNHNYRILVKMINLFCLHPVGFWLLSTLFQIAKPIVCQHSCYTKSCFIAPGELLQQPSLGQVSMKSNSCSKVCVYYGIKDRSAHSKFWLYRMTSHWCIKK